MNLAGIKAYVLTQFMASAESLKIQLSSLDQETLQNILMYGLFALAFFVSAGIVLIFFSLIRRRPGAQMDANQVSSDLSVLVRDLNTRVSNLSVQCKDEHLYLKQELRELKNMVAANHLEIGTESYSHKRDSRDLTS